MQKTVETTSKKHHPTMKRRLHRFISEKTFIFLLFQIFWGFFLFMYFKTTRYSNQMACFFSTKDNLSLTQKESNVLILLWTWPFGDRFPLDECPARYGITGCYFTADRSWYKYANAVIIHHYDVYSSKRKLPQVHRPRNQRWIWFNLESPSYSDNLHLMNNLFNLTLTYRQDSDIFTPYGWLEPLKEAQNFSIPIKSKLVAWVISNWKPDTKRVQYYEALKNYIPVDVFGKNHKPLPRNQHISTISQYKFYLAFENSQHKDYITEKVWDTSMLSWAVPVVLGPTRENYERFLPRDSFIHIDDFASAKDLAAYLLELDKDNKRYQRYFEWRSWFQVKNTTWQTHYCKACRALRQFPTYRTIHNLEQWYD